MTASTPTAFVEHCKMVAGMFAELEREYQWAHGVAHNKSVGDEVRIGDGVGDPTMTVLLSKRRVRRACEDANQAVLDCEKSLNAAINKLSSALHIVEPAPRFEPSRYRAEATRADIREALEAQERRYTRGEAVPE